MSLLNSLQSAEVVDGESILCTDGFVINCGSGV